MKPVRFRHGPYVFTVHEISAQAAARMNGWVTR